MHRVGQNFINEILQIRFDYIDKADSSSRSEFNSRINDENHKKLQNLFVLHDTAAQS